MPIRLKPIKEQVIVITGASSGIGLATALEAGRRGAQVVLASRDETDIQKAADQITAEGGKALAVVADVADQGAMESLAEQAVVAFNRIDTWVNNAGISIYGKLEEVPMDDAQRLFETNYWGVVNGSLAALPHLKPPRRGVDQRGERVVGDGDAAPGALLGEQARGEGVHRHAPYGAT